MLLLLFSGAGGSVPPPALTVTTCCFQPSAFQNNAFQNCAAGKVGWPDTLRRKAPRKVLNRLLKLQRDKTFGRRWFREFEEASKEFVQVEAVAAIAEAAKESRVAAELIYRSPQRTYHAPKLANLAVVLRDALENEESARLARIHARWLQWQVILEDDEEAILLLM